MTKRIAAGLAAAGLILAALVASSPSANASVCPQPPAAVHHVHHLGCS